VPGLLDAFYALLAAGCTIAERHRHFQPVTYVPPGLDATIKYGKKDLRMRNPYDQKLYIDATADGKSLVIRVRAEVPLPFRYELVAEEEEADHPIEDDGRPSAGGISVAYTERKYAARHSSVNSCSTATTTRRCI
jgi:vancomycin resistance protein YoaR